MATAAAAATAEDVLQLLLDVEGGWPLSGAPNPTSVARWLSTAAPVSNRVARDLARQLDNM